VVASLEDLFVKSCRQFFKEKHCRRLGRDRGSRANSLRWICWAPLVAVLLAPLDSAEERPNLVNDNNAISAEKKATELHALIERLGAQSYADRRQAFTELWQLGIQAEPWLNEAISSSDKQIAESAKRLLMLNKIRTHCDDIQLAGELVELFLNPSDESLVQLASGGHWELAELFLDEHPAFAIRAKESFYQQGISRGLIQVLVEQSLAQAQVARVWPLVARLVPPELAYWTARQLDLPEVEPPEDLHDRAMQLYIQGRVSEALELPIPWPLKLRLAVRGFQWQHLSNPSLQSALLGEQLSLGGQAARAVMYEFAGEQEAAEMAWRMALSSPVDEPDGPGAGDLLSEDRAESQAEWSEETAAALKAMQALYDSPQESSSLEQLQLALLLSGKVRPLEIFLEDVAPEAASDFYLARSDYASAFQQLGLEPVLGNLDAWIELQVAEARLLLPQLSRNQAQEAASLTPLMNLGKVGSLLLGLGFRDQAMKILEELFSLGQQNIRKQNPVWDRCILRWVGRDQWRACCLEMIARRFDDLPKNHESTIFSKLFVDLGDNAWLLYQNAPAFSGVSAADFDHQLALRQLDHLQRCDASLFANPALEVVKDWLMRTANQGPNLPGEERDNQVNRRSLAQIAHDWGLSRMALDILQAELVGSVDSTSAAQLAAEICLDMQQPQAALQLLNLSRPGPLDQHRDLPLRMQAMLVLGQWEAANLEYMAHWLRMSAVSWNGDRSAGYRASEDLIAQKKWQDALPFAERNYYLDRFGSYFFGFWEARQYSRILQELQQFEGSANVMRAVMVELLRPFSQTLRFFVDNNELGLLRYLAARERLSRAITLIERQEHQAAMHELEVCFQLQPLDIEAVISCYPIWVEAGRIDQADALFERYQTALNAHLEQWPNDAMNLNNMAWMYCQCDRNLEQALRMSEQAVELIPSSAVYLDTLAEVHFRMGDVGRAIELMRQCVTMDPREDHYRENLNRYRQVQSR
jgi:Tfp pilus assembly protein PilF